MQRLVLIWISLLLIADPVAAQDIPPDAETLRGWVQAMKRSPRGPFKHIRWFCNDGTVQLPQEYACKEHGGGVQHGEWTQRVRTLRANGYYIANILADIHAEEFKQNPLHETILKQMLLEQFLIEADNGWIFRRARYYRGALQVEDEARSGRALLLELLAEPGWQENRFILMREAVRFIPHGYRGAPITEMRQLSRSLAENDQNFETLRIKLHVKPEASDAQRVRNYGSTKGKPELAGDYAHLAEIIEKIFRSEDITAELGSLAKRIQDPQLAESLRQYSAKLSGQNDADVRFLAASRLLAALRDGITDAGDAARMLAILDSSLLLESELFRIGNAMVAQLPETNRDKRLSWLITYADGLYGIGLISTRQRRTLQQNLSQLLKTPPQLIQYKAELEYSARIPEWADRNLRFYFGEAVAQFEVIEPLALRYIHDRLRGSLLLSYTAVLESLIADANKQLGIRNFLFGHPADFGLRGLNAGLARGTLQILKSGQNVAKFDPAGIYVLPATTEDLPPVAGILTTGEGNILSHVLQGVVQLVADGPQWNPVFEKEKGVQDVLIRPDMEKLDVNTHRFIGLDKLRASDSGKICGPKAANLGELKRFFPEAVADGLVIPFGYFRAMLDQPIEPGGPTVYRWMQDQYKIIRRLEGDIRRQDQITQRFLKQMHAWIISADPGEEFRNRLRAAMQKTFGADGTYGVFVRSDTNVEDLPGFTGAGLNLTVPHVVGFENVMTAIARVWASPFTERAFRWRQAYMKAPEHVYASVLLMKSVPVEKSGVLVTADIDSGQPGWLTIAVSEGVGGAVSGQTAEELRINLQNGNVRLMAHATEPYKRVLLREGGIAKVRASGSEAVLNETEIKLLMEFAGNAPQRFPSLRERQGRPVPADIEFGFYQNRLMLFQIRPFLESAKARKNLLLNGLDNRLTQNHHKVVNLNEIPEQAKQ
jgi:hypothetical protein